MTVTRRHLVGAAGVAALAVGGGSWWLARNDRGAGAEIDPADLATASPLGDMTLGAPGAPVTIIEYASMTCPHCAAFHRTVFPELKAQYINTGKARFIFREFPIDLVAASSAMLARCIGGDNPQRYHAAVDRLFATQDQWMANDTKEQLRGIARQAGIGDDGFNACMADQRLLSGLQQCRDHAYAKLKVDATPTFFINGRRLVGARPFEEFADEIDMSQKA